MSLQRCAIEGCQYAGVSSYSAGRYYCDFHAELFDRGPEFKRCTAKVTQYASWWAVRDLKAKLGRIASCTLESDAKKLIDVVQQSPLRQYLPDPSVLDRKEIVNGIGERAGNASMEECVMALKTRADHFGIGCNIETTQIYRASRMIQTITGVAVAPTKPIIGANAFAHEAGIHQHGVMANKETYEIMTPESVGIPKNAIVLGKHSGRHAFEERLHELGYTLDHEKLEKAFEKFKILADKKKVIKDRDLEGLIGAVPVSGEERYTLDRFVINSGNTITSTAVIRVKKGDEMFERAAASDGPINASFHAIDKIIGKEIVLEDYSLRALTDGEDAQSEAIVKIRVDGSNEVVTGRGVSVDVMEASIKAYINGINKYFND